MSNKKDVSVLFVCLGNICRSPTADAVFAGRVEAKGLSYQIKVDSAGTAAYHVGSLPDRRSMATAQKRGYDMSHLRARQATVDDFYHFDYIFAMDKENLANLKTLQKKAGDGAQAKLALFLPFLAPNTPEPEVPDPYYGGDEGFEHVLDLIEAASDRLLDYLQQEHSL